MSAEYAWVMKMLAMLSESCSHFCSLSFKSKKIYGMKIPRRHGMISPMQGRVADIRLDRHRPRHKTILHKMRLADVPDITSSEHEKRINIHHDFDMPLIQHRRIFNNSLTHKVMKCFDMPAFQKNLPAVTLCDFGNGCLNGA